MSKNSFVRINHQIKSPELRVIGSEGENLGVISLSEALKQAGRVELDLIEISPTAVPPVAKIMDYGKFQYDQKKKAQKTKSKTQLVETKSIQIKPGTGEHDLELKAKKITDWLKKGHRVKVELYLRGRAKYMQPSFLKERLQRVLNFVTESYKIADGPKNSPKGLVVIIEKEKSS